MPKEIWTIEKIKDGFNKFYQLHNRYPTDYEVNDFKFLPTPRQIQRKFGGLVNLRKILGLTVCNYSIGKERSGIATSVNRRGKQCEIKIFEILKDKFDEKFVHIERPIGIYDTKNRYDFYIFTKNENFAVDVLSTEGDIRSFIKIMNIKENKYKKLNVGNIKLYFVYFGDKVEKERINKWKILSAEDFQKEINLYIPFGV